MKLYFLRHAHAVDGADESSDHARELTAEGVQAAETLAGLLERMKVRLDQIYSSPRVRARQTAEIVVERLKVPLAIREEVNFGFDVHAVTTLMHDQGNGGAIMFVGHEPTMSLTIGEITGGRVVMKKCGLARVDTYALNPLRGDLIWLIPPRVTAATIEE